MGSDHKGLYGDASGYYGTVEQQGRLTLHLYMLLWIKGTLSPEEMWQKSLDPDSDFHKSLLDYLDSVHSGDFLSGSQTEVEENVDKMMSHEDYQNPTEMLPVPPPAGVCSDNCSKCEQCVWQQNWLGTFQKTVDDLLLKSNTHQCTTNRNKDGSQNKAWSFTGCLDNIYGKCKAHFPRPIVQKTEIDEETGHIHMKKQAQWINTFMYVVTYLFCCNTDITSLRSGTSIRGVLLYITNYITKPTL